MAVRIAEGNRFFDARLHLHRFGQRNIIGIFFAEQPRHRLVACPNRRHSKANVLVVKSQNIKGIGDRLVSGAILDFIRMFFRAIIHRYKALKLADIQRDRSTHLISIDRRKVITAGFPNKLLAAFIDKLHLYARIAAGMIIVLNQNIRGSDWVKADGCNAIFNIPRLNGIDIIAVLLHEGAFIIHMPCAASQELLRCRLC